MIDQYPPANGVLTSLIWRKTMSGGETSLSGYDNASQALSYTPGQEQVYLNGILLVRGDDYTATNGTSITGLSALSSGDFIQVNCYNNFSVASVPSTSLTGTIANNQLANSSITINGTATSLGGTYTNASASTSSAGIVQLTDSTSSTSTTTAATPNSVKTAYDLANGAIAKSVIAAKGDLLVGTANDTVDILSTGTTGQVLTVDSATTSGLKWAAVSSGTNFTLRKSSETSQQIWTIAYNGSNLYVAAGAGGKLWTSPDGQTWTSRTSGFGSNIIRRVIYANSLWVAVGNAGLITTSTDGITWTARTANVGTNNLNDVAYANSTFVAVGNGGGTTNTGGITYSTDGITWTRKSQSLTVGAQYYTVIYNGTNWVVGAQYSTPNNALYASTPSGTWTAVFGGSVAGTIEKLVYDGTRTIFWDSNFVGYTTSTTFSSGMLTYDNVRYPNTITISGSYYNGYCYQFCGGWLVQFSSTPATNTLTSSDYKTPVMTPLGKPDTAGLQWDTGATFAGASGIILGTTYNEIYTSF
jgi:hypothetical protein